MTKELQELFDYLKDNYIPTDDDLSISGPNEDEDTDYISCDQKIITFVDEYYNICDLYDSHPCVRFKTKDEVVAFYNGCNHGFLYDLENDVEKAEGVGLVLSSDEALQLLSLNMPISPRQKKYNLVDTDEDKK
jgi:hypothetical protein